MKNYFFILLLLYYSLSTKAQNFIELANGEWAPFLSQNLPYFGFASHIVTEAFAEEGIHTQYLFLPWGRAEHDVRTGKVSGSVVWMKTPEREKFAWFSKPVMSLGEVLYYRRDKQLNWKEFSDLYGLRFAIPLGSTLGGWHEHEGNDKIKFIRAKDIKHSLLLLLKQRVDGFPYNKMVADHVLRTEFPLEKDLLTHSEKIISKNIYRLMLSKKRSSNKKILMKFNKGLDTLMHSEKYRKMIESYNNGEYDSIK
ncbi:substrate-binding periplasmic protein [Spartinivicinus poritis]|uniref:Transporter substrate-binding domain-containing protein n=1 Tax=Spartinivicinus poritis TaxID=2994640 RepID=A0ABT5UAP0_9GAMM|nr:transporter substrate-binding domain-containing protein [Spartinivicinus sp. A2-2]MDE1462194.1 transporter substrate-binding domain-containing protein [Spartinivicinus sp. A2-2]